MHGCILPDVTAGEQTRQARAATTRLLLLDTTVACLAELGYAGTTGPAVAERAGLSRGAQLHHFGTRDQMVVAAVEHLAQQRLTHVDDSLAKRMGDRADASAQSSRAAALAALELLAEAMSGPLYGATLELWAAARTNDDLRKHLVPAEERVRADLRDVCRAWITTDPLLVELTLDLLRGRGVSGMLVPHPSDAQRLVLERWIDTIDAVETIGAVGFREGGRAQ